MSSLPKLVMAEKIIIKTTLKKETLLFLTAQLIFSKLLSPFQVQQTIKWPHFLDEKNGVFNSGTVVLGYHMLHLNTVRQL